MRKIGIDYVYETSAGAFRDEIRWRGILELELPEIDPELVKPALVVEEGGSTREWTTYGGVHLETIAGMGRTFVDDPASHAASLVLSSRGVVGINVEEFRKRGRPKAGSFVRSTEERIVEGIRDAMEGSIFVGDSLRIRSGIPCLTLPLDMEGSMPATGATGSINPSRKLLCFGYGETERLEEWRNALGARAGIWKVRSIDPELAGNTMATGRMKETASRILGAAGPHLFRLPTDRLADYAALRRWHSGVETSSSDVTAAAACGSAVVLLDFLARERLLDRTLRSLAPALASDCADVLEASGVETVPDEDLGAYALAF